MNLTHIVGKERGETKMLSRQKENKSSKKDDDVDNKTTEGESLDARVAKIVDSVLKKTNTKKDLVYTTTTHPPPVIFIETPRPTTSKRAKPTKQNLAAALALKLGAMENKLNSDKDDSEVTPPPIEKLDGRIIGDLESVPTTPNFELMKPTTAPKYTLRALSLPKLTRYQNHVRPQNFDGTIENAFSELQSDEESLTTTLPRKHVAKMPAEAVLGENLEETKSKLEKVNIDDVLGENDDELFEPMEVTNQKSSRNKEDMLDAISLKTIMAEKEKKENVAEMDDTTNIPDDIQPVLSYNKKFEEVEFHPEFTKTDGASRGPDEFSFTTKRPYITARGETTKIPETDREGPNMVDITEILMGRHHNKANETLTLRAFFNATNQLEKKDRIEKATNKPSQRKEFVPDYKGNKIMNLFSP